MEPNLDGQRVVRGLIRIGEVLSSNQPLEERMTFLCKETVSILNCDRSSIMLREGDRYQAKFNWGNPPDIAEGFPNFSISVKAPLFDEMNKTGTFLVFNDARLHVATAKVAEGARIESIVIAPLFRGSLEPIGFMTAEFNERFGTFDTQRAEIVLGAARLAQAAIITDVERLARRRSGNVQRELLERLVGAEDRERRRISADIHDDPLQQVTALMHSLEIAAAKSTDEETRGLLMGLVDQSESAAMSLRDLIQDVHPLSVDTGGLRGAIETTLTRLGEKNSWTVHISDSTSSELPPAVVTILYRITQQALANVALHAQATTVTVEMSAAQGFVEVIVIDDGIGFDRALVPGDRHGLIAMAERAEYAGGSCRIDSSPGGGTVVTIRAPIRN